MKKLLFLLLFTQFISAQLVIPDGYEYLLEAKDLLELDEDYEFKDGDIVRVIIRDKVLFFVNRITTSDNYNSGKYTNSQFVQDSLIIPSQFLAKTVFDVGDYSNYFNTTPNSGTNFGLPHWFYNLANDGKLNKTKYYVGKKSINVYGGGNTTRHTSRAKFYYTKNKLSIDLRPYYNSSIRSPQEGFQDEHIFERNHFLVRSYKAFPTEGRIHSKLPLRLYFNFSKNDFDYSNNYDIEIPTNAKYFYQDNFNKVIEQSRNRIIVNIGDLENESYLNIDLTYYNSNNLNNIKGLLLESKLFYKGIETASERYDGLSEPVFYSDGQGGGGQYYKHNDDQWSLSSQPSKIKILKESENFIIAIDDKPLFLIPLIEFKNFEIEAYQNVAIPSQLYNKGSKDSRLSRYATIKSYSDLESEVNAFWKRNQVMNISRISINQDLDDYNVFVDVNSSEWKGSGSGFFVSNNGHIATNNHVIEDARAIEVSFDNGNEILNYSAEIVQTDPSNDLAILKINDIDFKEFQKLPYNIKTRSSDVGSEVFVLGYPMALTGMGEEIKFAEGRISSKTGFNGDIRLYQTTTPVQAGNSGGPLFDFNGNLIGIISSKISSDIADNVSYSIKSSYLGNLMDVLPENILFPSSTELTGKPLIEIIKKLSKYVVLIKVK